MTARCGWWASRRHRRLRAKDRASLSSIEPRKRLGYVAGWVVRLPHWCCPCSGYFDRGFSIERAAEREIL